MKIAINGRFLLPGKLEGIGHHTREITHRLALAFPQVDFTVLMDRKVDKNWGFPPNVHIKILPPQARHPVLFYWWFQRSVKKYLKTSGCICFISFDGFCTLGAPCPTILTVHDVAYLRFSDHVSAPMQWYYSYFMPKFLKEAQAVITVSAFSKSELIHFFPEIASKLYISCNAPRQIFKKAYEAEPAKRDFIVLGAIQPRKNLRNVVKAFVLFKANTGYSSTLKIVGRKGWKYRDVLDIARRSAYSNDIHFTGYLKDEELIKTLKKSMALVYVSLYEGFGIPILEAMSLGLPVITSDTGAMKEVAGDDALFVDPTDIINIAKGMRKMYEDEGLRNNLVEKGLKRAEHYSWEKAAQPYIQLLQQMLQK